MDTHAKPWTIETRLPKPVSYRPLGDDLARGRLEAPTVVELVAVRNADDVGNGGGPMGVTVRCQLLETLDGRGLSYKITRLTADSLLGFAFESLRSFPLASVMRIGLAREIRLLADEGDHLRRVEAPGVEDPLWETALVYAVAAAIGSRPTAAVAEHFGVTSSAAAQRVRRARAAGMIPATTRGKVGR